MNPFLLGFENEYSLFFFDTCTFRSCSNLILWITAFRHLILVFMSFISSVSTTPLVFCMLRITSLLKYSPRFSSAYICKALCLEMPASLLAFGFKLISILLDEAFEEGLFFALDKAILSNVRSYSVCGKCYSNQASRA